MTDLSLTDFSLPVLPLTGKTILVTRAAGQSSQFTQLLQQQGATVLEMPAIEIMPPSSWEWLDQAIAQLEQFDWLILTSTNGVDYFFERLTAQGQTSTALQTLKIAVVGQKTAAALSRYGRAADFIPPNYVADSLVAHFPAVDWPTLNILFPRVETGGREMLVKELRDRGATVVEVPAYQSGCTQTIPPAVKSALQNSQIDVVTFASSKTVDCVYRLLLHQADTHPIALLPGVCIASIGPQTSATCQKSFGRVDLEATDYTLEGLTQTLVQWSIGQ